MGITPAITEFCGVVHVPSPHTVARVLYHIVFVLRGVVLPIGIVRIVGGNRCRKPKLVAFPDAHRVARRPIAPNLERAARRRRFVEECGGAYALSGGRGADFKFAVVVLVSDRRREEGEVAVLDAHRGRGLCAIEVIDGDGLVKLARRRDFAKFLIEILLDVVEDVLDVVHDILTVASVANIHKRIDLLIDLVTVIVEFVPQHTNLILHLRRSCNANRCCNKC